MLGILCSLIFIIVGLFLIYKLFGLLAQLFFMVIGILSLERHTISHLLVISLSIFFAYLAFVHDNIFCVLVAGFLGFAWLVWFLNFITGDVNTVHIQNDATLSQSIHSHSHSRFGWLSTGATLLAFAWLFGRHNHNDNVAPPPEHHNENFNDNTVDNCPHDNCDCNIDDFSDYDYYDGE